jgi:hypothetical protein
MTPFTRRRFLQSTAAAASACVASSRAFAARTTTPFSFALLGDLHYDKLEHHDMAWLEKNKGGDLSQIRNYSRITAELMPRLFASVKETLVEYGGASAAPAAFVLQVGDIVEGLCGTAELAARQDREALAFVAEQKLGVPFLFTKGNHDVTGDGATEAFAEVFHPFLTQQRGALARDNVTLTTANYTLHHGAADFFFFDAYDKASLDWLEAALTKRSAPHCFVIIHPPVVPYGARATWNIYSSEKLKPQREKLLALLGGQEAFVLGGHIHKYCTLVRKAGKGRFLQLAVSSVVNSSDTSARDILTGVEAYNGDQVRVEPKFSPETEPQRRAVYAEERPAIQSFEYADLPGHAVVTVNGAQVTAKIYSGISRTIWKELNLTGIRSKAAA